MIENENSLDIKFNPNNYNILIVEDSKSINRMLLEEFKELNYNCFTAFSIKEATEIYEQNSIDYLMLDLNLPDGLGTTLIQEFEDTNTKIFVLTGESSKELIDQSYKKGVIDFIHKDKEFFHKIDDIAKTIEKLEKNKLKRILVVDDSKVIQAQLKELLSNRHYMIEVAEDTKTAEEIIHSKEINLILLDVNLKDSNGLTYLQENKVELITKRKIPIMIISSFLDPTLIRDGLKAGAVDVIQKPYIPEEVVLKVDLWIDYKRKEEEIENSTSLLTQYKETVDRSSIVYKTDPEGRIIYVNDEFCKVTEYSKNELLGQDLKIIRHKDMKDEFYENLWETIKIKKKPWKGKIKNKKKSGEHFWISTIINPILDADENIIEYIAISKDTTQNELIHDYFKNQLSTSNENLEHAMTKANEYQRAMYESNIISRIDLKGKITFVNEKFCKISGYTKAELIGEHSSIVSHKDTKAEVYAELARTIRNGNIWKGILKNSTKDNKTYWVDVTVVPIKDKDNNITEYMSIRHDLTELFELHDEIENTQKEIIYRMGEIGETRSNETGNHVKRVALYSKLLAELHGLDEENTDLLFTASPMHDIGKVGIPDAILKKPGKLTENEFEFMKKHAEIGYHILKGSQRKVLKTAAIVSYEHHEKWDGSGYPRGLKEEEIHIFGRITAIADVYDALGSERCYKKAWSDEKIFNLFEEEKGKSFDPKLIELFFENKDEFFKIRDAYTD